MNIPQGYLHTHISWFQKNTFSKYCHLHYKCHPNSHSWNHILWLFEYSISHSSRRTRQNRLYTLYYERTSHRNQDKLQCDRRNDYWITAPPTPSYICAKCHHALIQVPHSQMCTIKKNRNLKKLNFLRGGMDGGVNCHVNSCMATEDLPADSGGGGGGFGSYKTMFHSLCSILTLGGLRKDRFFFSFFFPLDWKVLQLSTRPSLVSWLTSIINPYHHTQMTILSIDLSI